MSNILLINCPDRPGLIHTITGVLLHWNVNIVSNAEFVEPESGLFYMRTEFTGDVQGKELVDLLRGKLPAGSQVRIAPNAPKKIVILAGKEPHCLGDLLLRHYNREINVEVQAVVSNHATLEELTKRFDIPFHHVPCLSEDRKAHETQLLAALHPYRPDYLVLAKYMRVLTADFITFYPSRILNIHHSFLPAFVGAQPYRQAFNRGVKIIGATAHFVTEKLDDGPIIAQAVIPVNHAHTSQDMAQEGREIEKVVLARAVSLVAEDRVFISGNKTVIFE